MHDLRQLFDEDWYLLQHPEIAASGGDPFAHYLETGWREGHQPHPRATADWLSEFSRRGAFGNLLASYSPVTSAFNLACTQIDSSRKTVLVVTHEASPTPSSAIALRLVETFAKNFQVVTLMLQAGSLSEVFRERSRVANIHQGGKGLDTATMNVLVSILIRHAPIEFAIVNSIESWRVLHCLARNDVPIVNLVHEFASDSGFLRKIRVATLYADLNVFPTETARKNAMRQSSNMRQRATRILSHQDLNSGGYGQRIATFAEEARGARRQQIADRETIEKSGIFDSAYFAMPNRPDIEIAWPWRYVQGWAGNIGTREPFPGFNPAKYRESLEICSRDPLAHYLEAGRPEGTWQKTVLVPDGKIRPPPAPGQTALHVHVFYEEMVEEICAALLRNASPVDIFLTGPETIAWNKICQRFQSCGLGRVEAMVVPNCGRDIGPLLTGLRESEFWNYEIIGHIHTKRTVWTENPDGVKLWRNLLLEKSLGGCQAMMDRVLSAFVEDPRLGFVFPADPNVYGWGPNRPLAEELALPLGLSRLPDAIDFPIGTFFWARSDALRRCVELNLDWEDYPSEPLPSDGTILHALERLFALVASDSGYAIAVAHVPGITR